MAEKIQQARARLHAFIIDKASLDKDTLLARPFSGASAVLFVEFASFALYNATQLDFFGMFNCLIVVFFLVQDQFKNFLLEDSVEVSNNAVKNSKRAVKAVVTLYGILKTTVPEALTEQAEEFASILSTFAEPEGEDNGKEEDEPFIH